MSPSSVNTNFHNTIAKLCIDHFESLPKTGKPKENEWTTLSCIVLQNESKFEVVALGTGTKCIGKNKMSKDGDILNDSHAEVICRRAFLRFIYNEILSNSSLFVFDKERQSFHIKNNVHFHFFSTHVPCGDAAIFPKQNCEEFGSVINNTTDETINDAVERKRIKLDNECDIFRTGAKCLETDEKQDLKAQGADYHVVGVVRTKPGRGVPTLSVSCSDKLAKWCHLGLQGALLSILLSSPVYFQGFTIAGGTPFNEEAVKRAFFGRLGDLSLESPYCRNNAILGQAELEFSFGKSEGKNPCSSSIVWCKTSSVERKCEVAVDGRRQGVTKKHLKTKGALKICKLKLFEAFMEVIKKFEIRLSAGGFLDNLTYKDAKLCAVKYQRCWAVLKRSFKVWTVKDESLLTFRVKTYVT